MSDTILLKINMANYYTEGSAILALQASQERAAKDVIARVIEELESSDDGVCGCVAEVELCEDGLGVWFHHDESINPEHVAVIARALIEELEIDEPFIFSWAHTCSKPRTDAFGGGAFAMKRGHETYWVDAETHVRQHVESWLTPTDAAQEDRAPSVQDCPCDGSVVEETVSICRKAGVERVVAAIHFGALHFLLSDGPENVGGIVFRDDTYSMEDLKALAEKVNKLLLLETPST